MSGSGRGVALKTAGMLNSTRKRAIEIPVTFVFISKFDPSFLNLSCKRFYLCPPQNRNGRCNLRSAAGRQLSARRQDVATARLAHECVNAFRFQNLAENLHAFVR